MTSEDLAYVAELVRHHAGVVLKGDKAFFIETRLGPVARREKAPGVSALVDQVRRNPAPDLVKALVEATLMQETGFFRDRAVFRTLKQSVMPQLSSRREGRGLRILSAGCATGQETYSVAMLAADLFPASAVEIIGVDFAPRSLEKAKAGLYTHFEVQRGLPIRRLLAHFEPVDDNWRVASSLRQAVKWGEFNLLGDMRPLGVFDLILCRNVLHSLTPEAASRLLDMLDNALAPDGVLVIGAREEAILSPAFSAGDADGVWMRNPAFQREAVLV